MDNLVTFIKKAEKMTPGRKPRSDSIAGQIALQEALQKPIYSPAPLDDDEVVIFDELIGGLPRLKWDDQSVRMVGMLAKMTHHLNGLIEKVIVEGAVLENGRLNPTHTAMVQTTSTVRSLRASLGLSASQRAITKSTNKPSEIEEERAKAALTVVGGKHLLA